MTQPLFSLTRVDSWAIIFSKPINQIMTHTQQQKYTAQFVKKNFKDNAGHDPATIGTGKKLACQNELFLINRFMTTEALKARQSLSSTDFLCYNQ